MREKHKIIALLIIILGIFTRFIFLNKIPNGLHFDEARNGLDAIKITSGVYKSFIFQPVLPGTIDSAKEALFANILALTISLKNKDIITLRTTTAVISSISIILFFYMAYLFFDKDLKRTIIALSIFTFSSVNLIISRLVFRVNLTIPILISSTLFVLLSIKEEKHKYIYLFCFGLVNALGVYTYNSYLIMFLFLYLFLFYSLKEKKPLLISILATGFVLLPFLVYVKNPQHFNEYTKHARELSVFNPIWTHKSEKEIIKAMAKNMFLDIQMFFFYGDKNRRHNAYSLPLIDIPLNIIFLISLWKAIKRRAFRNTNFLLPILGIAVSLIPGVTAYQGNPHFLRTFQAIVFTPLLISESLNELIKKEKIISLILTTFVLFSLFKVFFLWGQRSNLLEVFGGSEYEIADYIANNNYLKDRNVFILDTGIKKQTIMYLTNNFNNIKYLDRIEFEDRLKHKLTQKEILFAPSTTYKLKYLEDTIRNTPNNKEIKGRKAHFLIFYR